LLGVLEGSWAERTDLEFLSDPPAGSAVSDGGVHDPPPLYIVVADLGVVGVRLLSAGEHPAAAQVIDAQHPLDVGHSLSHQVFEYYRINRP
jgi:hypothetical protein